MTAIRRASIMGDGLSSAGVVNRKIQDDWDTIADICESGRASEFYSVGDYKPLTLTNGTSVNMCLIGFNRDHNLDGLPTTSFLSAQTVKKYTDVNSNVGYCGWRINKEISATSMEGYYRDTIYPLIPTNVKTRIKPVSKSFQSYEVTKSMQTSSTYMPVSMTRYKVTNIWPPDICDFYSNASDTIGDFVFYPEYRDFVEQGGTPAAAGPNMTASFICRSYSYGRCSRSTSSGITYDVTHFIGEITSTGIFLLNVSTVYSPRYSPSSNLGYALGFCL